MIQENNTPKDCSDVQHRRISCPVDDPGSAHLLPTSLQAATSTRTNAFKLGATLSKYIIPTKIVLRNWTETIEDLKCCYLLVY